MPAAVFCAVAAHRVPFIMPAVKTYAVINQKGGVGKTTTVANLGAAIAATGHDICLIDLDPQSHLTLHYGIDTSQDAPSVYDVMTDEINVAAAVRSVAPHLSVAPATIDLAATEIELVNTVGREQVLRDRLHAEALPCETVLIDCPPSLGLLTLNALAAADEVLIPLQPHFLALQGLGKLLETVSLVQRRINPALKVTGVVFCMYETQTRLAAEVAADLAGFLEGARGADVPWSGAKVFETHIRRNVKLAECPSHGQTIFQYEPQSNGAEDYQALAAEFLALATNRASAAQSQTTTQDSIQAAEGPAGPPESARAEAGEELTETLADKEPRRGDSAIAQAEPPQPTPPAEPSAVDASNSQDPRPVSHGQNTPPRPE